MRRETHLTDDWLVVGFASGVAASLVKSAVNRLLKRAGVPTVTYESFAGGWALGRRARLGGRLPGEPHSWGEGMLGQVTETLYGGLFGAGISYVMTRTPPGREALKGAIGGAALWAGVITTLNQCQRPRRITGGQMATMLAMNVLYGGLHGALLGRHLQRRAETEERTGRHAGVRACPGRRVRRVAPAGRVVLPPPRPLDEGLKPVLH